MIKYNICESCKKSIEIEIICDTCGKTLYPNDNIKPMINVIILGTDYHFDNYSCLLKFIIEELKKQQPQGESNETTP